MGADIGEIQLLRSEVVVTRDVMVATVFLEDGYGATLNHAGAAGGARHDAGFSLAYRRVKATFESIARQAVAKGWITVQHPAEWQLIRFVPDERVFDAINMGSAEANGFTDGHAWTDDGVARDARLRRLTDREGADRLVSILLRIPASSDARPITPRSKKPRRTRKTSVAEKNPPKPSAARAPRTVAQMKSGDVLTLDEVAQLRRDGLL